MEHFPQFHLPISKKYLKKDVYEKITKKTGRKK